MKIKIILITILLVSVNSLSQGKLDIAKESLKQNSNSSSVKDRNSSTSYNSGNGGFFSEIVVAIIVNLTYGIVVETVFEKESKMHDASITKYPYFSKKQGNYVYSNSINTKKIRLDLQTNLVAESKKLFGNNFTAKFRFVKRFDAELNYLQLFEKTNLGTDNFTQFTLLLNYHRIRTQKLDLYYGLGITHIANEVSETGFSYNIGAEWFVVKPVSIAVSYKGSMINDENVDNSKIHLKYYFKNYHLSSGYEHFALGVVDINTFSLGFGASF